VTDSESDLLQRELNNLRLSLATLIDDQRAHTDRLEEAIELLAQRIGSPAAREAAEDFHEEEAEAPFLIDPIPALSVETSEAVRSFRESRMADAPPSDIAAPPPYPVPAKAAAGSFEMRLGRVWLGRIGIAILVTGLVLLGNFAYKNWVHDLPPIVRLLLLYMGAGGLIGAGLFVRKKESTAVFGEVLLAGGLAFAYWCTFAAHHVPRLRVIESPIIGALLVFGAAGIITSLSLAWRSRIIGVMGLLLASYSTVLQPLGWLSSVSNLALAIAGVVMMLRAGWAGPGVVAMGGSYLSFFWWQIASGQPGEDPASLWFLPPVWAVFAISVLLRPSEEIALSPRGRAFFASVNNLAFFGLFSGIWLKIYGHEDYWIVAAVFGCVLLGLGSLRRARATIGGLFFAQGLAAITIAVVLKLDGYQLALGLSIQAIALAVAFSRFGGRSELTFGAVTAVGASFLCLFASLSPSAPLWSDGLVGVFVMAAGVFLRRGCELSHVAGNRKVVARGLAMTLLILGSAVLLFDFCAGLDPVWRCPSAAVVGFLIALGWLKFDRARMLPELAVISMGFGLFSVAAEVMIPEVFPWWPAGVVCVISILVHWLWHVSGTDTDAALTKRLRETGSWASSLFVAAAATLAIWQTSGDDASKMLLLSGSSVALAALGRYGIRTPRLCISGALLLPGIIALQMEGGPFSLWRCLVPVAGTLGVLAVSALPPESVKQRDLSIAQGLSRFFASCSWLLACREILPETWGEVMALTALFLGAPAMIKGWRSLFSETAAFLAIGFSWYVAHTSAESWRETIPNPGFAGWATVATAFALGFLMKPSSKDGRTIRDGLLFAAFALLAVWSSHILVWNFGPKPVVVLWAALGFGAVSVGLWRKLVVLRYAGFVILTVAMLKLFLVDVWDLDAFVRVVAFLALGVALVMLGFFYNRFADIIKKLFEGEGAD
jgi:uncharacterized membrane protein